MPKRLLEMAAAGCILMVVAAIAPLCAQQIVVSKDNRTIAVTNSADASVDADTAMVHIGFAVYGPDQQMAGGLNASLGQLIYASNEAPARPPIRRMAAPRTAIQAGAVEPLSVEARKVTRSATVYAVFAIQ